MSAAESFRDMDVAAYPSGTVAFLFTDIEGSTARWERDQAAMWAAVERHFALLREAIVAERGVLFKTIGDAVQAAFPTTGAAVRAAITAQRLIADEDFGKVDGLRVRMAIHVGEAAPIDGDYLAPALNRLARVLSAGYGEQVLLSEAAAGVAELPEGYTLRDLGAHRLKDLLTAEHIYQLAGPGLRAQFPPLKTLDQRPHNLPAQPTPLIGRDAEVAELRQMFTASGARLVTLTGPGGSGKSRLAVQTAAELQEAFVDGVWWVPLAAIIDPALVTEAIASVLGLSEQPGQPLADTIIAYLRGRKTLLVLDNLEQVLSVAPVLGDLLDTVPELAILATSREPLRLRREQEYPVPPLALPVAGRSVSAAEAEAFPAVQLFVDRAQAVKSGFALSDANAAAVIAICRQLDGLPLAIELAAARVRLLPPAALLARLEKRLSLLTGGARDLPERQQTLRATIAWSYDLLDPGERSMFARLAVFVGGCTIAAAIAVAESGEPLPIDPLDGLEGLVLKSLVRREDDLAAEPRFSMLETIREFGLEQLAANPDEERNVRAAHAAFFREVVDLAIAAEDQVASFADLETELGNLRSVLDWQERQGEGEAVLEFATDLSWFWWVRGHLREGRDRLDGALRAVGNPSPALRANALSGLGLLLVASGDDTRAKPLYEEALALYRALDDQPGVAEAFENLGIIAANSGDLDLSTTMREEVLELRRTLGDKRGIAVALINLGNVAFLRGNYEQAIGRYEEARVLSVETGDQMILSIALGNTAGAMIRQRDDKNPDQTGDIESRANTVAREALRLAGELGDHERILDDLFILAEIAALREPARAAVLLGAAEAIAEATGFQLSAVDPDHRERVITIIRDSLPGNEFDTRRREGTQLSLPEAIAFAQRA
ncbi:MAG: tetratricopeptide repeat protein [Thermomicrobiales bacterium]